MKSVLKKNTKMNPVLKKKKTRFKLYIKIIFSTKRQCK